MRTIAYLDQAKLGRARWYDFVIGAWFLFIGWILGQLLFVMPIGEIAAGLDIQMSSEEDMEAVAAVVEESPMTGLGSLLMLLSAAIVPITYLISRNTSEGVRKAFGIICGVFVALSVLGLVMAFPLLMASNTEEANDVMGQIIGQSPVAYGLILFSFIGAIIAAWLVQRFIHYRTMTSLITAAAKVRWMRIVWVLLLTWGVYAVMAFVSVHILGAEVYANPERSRMLPFVIATLLFIPIQCAAEEIMFRGYLNQALARFIPNILVVFAITSILFGALHLANPEIGAAKENGTFWLVASSYVLMGFMFSVLVWIDNGLEAAIGVHIANNAWAATFINMETSVLPVPGLYLSKDSGGEMMATGLIMMGLVILGVWLTRKPLPSRGKVVTEGDSVDVFA